MTTVKPESFWRSTLGQTVVGIGAIVACTATVCFFLARVETRLVSIEKGMSNVVTLTHAERYAAAVRWENRGQGIVVPDIMLYRDLPENRIQ